MNRRIKLMTSLSTLAAVSALTVAGCSDNSSDDQSQTDSIAADDVADADGGAMGHAMPTASSDGESEASALEADPATNDVEYIHLLGLTRGHLIAFHTLYNSGAKPMAMMHVKHPESELYAVMEPAFVARDQPGFAKELVTLAQTAKSDGDIEADFAKVVDAMNAHTPDTSVANKILAVSEIARTAALEFDIGVEDDGAISNAHEYQDAFGFLTASRVLLKNIDTSDANEIDAVKQAQEQIELALKEFDDLTAPQTHGTPSHIFGAAARIEIAARGLM